ncbi:nitroreductase family protein [Poseidonocella sedimentorum]|uniref:Putative NAD(P)H nitroreductase n=1 Tax=Poseidonocella sedimentorum TaxID=871652 RepID=A0A1I6E7Y5_9RHOB|nr:nitroreductase [Poseidonocella sedimentorum]SFR13682.1 Nitroreductase [Poseidonocella sedimentorum]
MTRSNPAALEFLLTRRSRPAKILGAPYPERSEVETLLQAAARTPDHGKLEPWRFIVLRGAALTRMAEAVRTAGERRGEPEGVIEKSMAAFADAGLVVTVVEAQKPSDKVPAIEQTYSAGAVCLALLNAALASGWGANWLSGFASHDEGFGRDALGLEPNERIAGFIHIGTGKSTPPDRPRPNLDSITSWVDT